MCGAGRGGGERECQPLGGVVTRANERNSMARQRQSTYGAWVGAGRGRVKAMWSSAIECHPRGVGRVTRGNTRSATAHPPTNARGPGWAGSGRAGAGLGRAGGKHCARGVRSRADWGQVHLVDAVLLKDYDLADGAIYTARGVERVRGDVELHIVQRHQEHRARHCCHAAAAVRSNRSERAFYASTKVFGLM